MQGCRHGTVVERGPQALGDQLLITMPGSFKAGAGSARSPAEGGDENSTGVNSGEKHLGAEIMTGEEKEDKSTLQRRR